MKTSPGGILDQPPIEPDHLGITLDAEALISAVKAF